MAKKRGNTKKINSSLKVSNSFNSLSFQNKVISVVLIALMISIVASLFPGNLTGMQVGIFNNPTFSEARYTLDNIIRTVFPFEFPTNNIIIYEKFVLFLLLFTLLSGAAKFLNFRGMTNVIVAGSISLISVWFIPAEVLAMIGVTYGSVYASLLMLIPIFTVGYLAWKIPGTRGGCAAKAVIFFVLLSVFGATRDGLQSIYGVGNWYRSYVDTIILILIILAIYYVIRAITLSAHAESAARTRWAQERAENSIASVILTRVEENIAGGAQRAQRRPQRRP